MKAKLKKRVSSATRRIRNTLSPPDQPSVSRTSSTGELQASNIGTPELRSLESHNASDVSVGVIGPSLDAPLRPSEKMVAVPTQDIAGSGTQIDPPGFVWSGLRVLQCVLRESAEVFSPLASAVTDVSQCIEAFEKEAQARRDYQTLKADLDASFTNLTELLAAAGTPATKAAVAQAVEWVAHAMGGAKLISESSVIKNEIELIVEKTKRSKTMRLKDAMKDVDEIETFYRRTQHIMTQLIIRVNTNMLQAANEQIKDQRVKTLPDSPDALYHSARATKLRRGACMQNTRVQLLQELWSWSEDPQGHRIFWLNGMAGTGKTTIAYSLCEQLQSAGRLGASFFCSRQLWECREVNRIVPSIARQLSCSKVFRDRLSEILEEVPDAYNRPLGEQFERLIAAPLRLAGDSFPANQVVIVDALDECDDKDSVDLLLEVVLSQGLALPLRFFVTSRPEAKIRDQMMDERHIGLRHEMRLHELDRKISQEDIRTYLTVELKRAKVTPAELEALVARAGVLFIYAATVVRYVGYDNFLRSTSRLKQVLSISGVSTGLPERHVDSLYESILEQAMRDPDMEETESLLMADVLGTVVCSREPLSLESIGRLLGLEDLGQVAFALRPLASVLHVPKTTEVVVALHESFPNYMLDANRSGRFWCMPQKRNADMAHQCLGLIEQVNPPFNICKLESSFVLDDEVPNLKEKIRRHISDPLLYACCHWAEHIERSDQAEQFVTSVQGLMEKRLLLWIEIMNLKKRQPQVGVALSKMMSWSQLARCSTDTMELIRDAMHFVRLFYMGPAWRSTPHIYISGMTYWPKDRTLSRHYTNLIDSGVLMTGTAMSRHTFRALGTIQTGGMAAICCAAYAPNGTHIVSGLSDHTIRIWDAHTGQPVGQPLTGHTGSIRAVAYSPDGTYIVSGSNDHTLRIWDAHSSQQVGQPLTAHADHVRSIAYSPDGTRIASGSRDCTLGIWDAHTGQLVNHLLTGHKYSICSVAYSPDSTCIVSGSDDNTLRIWDVQTGQRVGQPLTGHTNSVHSVAYSPNGMHIVSGSADCTLRIWDAHTGQPVGQPLTAHTGRILSVTYSPDGLYIACGSLDGMLHIWNSESGQQVGQPFTGHADGIWLVAYSPDGSYIVSGDGPNLCIWDAHVNQQEEQPLTGHTGSIYSVAYSPDGLRIVSGSEDSDICIWDTCTGQQVGQPLTAHTGMIYSVAYSPDGVHVASGSHGRDLCIWDTRTSQQVGKSLTANAYSVSVAYSPDGTHIVTMSGNALRIWNIHNGQQVGQPLTGHTLGIRSVAYSPNGAHIVSGSHDRTLRIWDVRTGQQVGQPLTGHTGAVCSVAYSPDGTHIVSGSADNTLRIWDAHSGQQLGESITSHTNSISSAVYLPGGAYIASGSYDSTLSIWNVQAGKQTGQLLTGHTSDICSIACSPDGRHLASSSSDETIRIWDISTIQQMEQSLTDLASGGYIATNLAENALHIQSVQTDQMSARHQSHCLTGQCYCDWTLSNDGWITANGNRRLVWVPAKLRVSLLRPQNTLLISRHGSLRVDFSRALIGLDWTQCYQRA